MRIFAAIDMPERVRSELGSLIVNFQRHQADVRWTHPSHFHLTLRFFGEVDESSVPQIKSILQAAASKVKRFQMRLAGLSAFPDLKRPSVLWVGVDEGKSSIESLEKEIQSACPEQDPKHPFHAHVTLGRVGEGKNLPALVGEMKWTTFSSGHRFEADHLTLYRSTLGAKKPVYDALERFAFAKA